MFGYQIPVGNQMPSTKPTTKYRGLVLLFGVALVLTISATPAEAQGYSYAVKFVCGFNKSNLGTLTDADATPGGENVVKLGNYATDVNIYNPNNDIEIKKKALILVKEGSPVGREPKVVVPNTPGTSIGLPTCSATYDDCNEILRLAGVNVAPGTLPGLYIGFLVIESEVELNVTAVYTAEVCSDYTNVGPDRMCMSQAGVNGVASFGAALSIDVEQIRATRVN